MISELFQSPAFQVSGSSIDHRWLGRVSYAEGLELQDELVRQRRANEIPDTILYLEHEPVYTIGRTQDQSSLKTDVPLPYPVFSTNRGGQATYHGPGQLTVYPILKLQHYGADLHVYLRALEEAVIQASVAYGIDATRQDGLTGVWVGRDKLASIGVGVRHWVSMHGLAVNVTSDLSGFDAIIPCGLSGVKMTSIALASQRKVSVAEFAETLQTALAGVLENCRAEGTSL